MGQFCTLSGTLFILRNEVKDYKDDPEIYAHIGQVKNREHPEIHVIYDISKYRPVKKIPQASAQYQAKINVQKQVLIARLFVIVDYKKAYNNADQYEEQPLARKKPERDPGIPHIGQAEKAFYYRNGPGRRKARESDGF
jgi:hypothetical protein